MNNPEYPYYFDGERVEVCNHMGEWKAGTIHGTGFVYGTYEVGVVRLQHGTRVMHGVATSRLRRPTEREPAIPIVVGVAVQVVREMTLYPEIAVGARATVKAPSHANPSEDTDHFWWCVIDGTEFMADAGEIKVVT